MWPRYRKTPIPWKDRLRSVGHVRGGGGEAPSSRLRHGFAEGHEAVRTGERLDDGRGRRVSRRRVSLHFIPLVMDPTGRESG